MKQFSPTANSCAFSFLLHPAQPVGEIRAIWWPGKTQLNSGRKKGGKIRIPVPGKICNDVI